MPHLNNILNQLKSHAVKPPEELFDIIVSTIKTENDGIIGIVGDDELKLFQGLGGNVVQPPAFLLDNILAAVKEKEKPAAKVFNIKRSALSRFAAAVLILSGSWGIYNMINKKGTAEFSTTNNHSASLIKAPETPEKTSENPGTAALETNTIKKIPHTNRKPRGSFAQPSYIATANGYDFPVTNNDLLVSFASFKQNNLPDFITSSETKSVEISVDRSTAITVSENMVAMMKTLYKTKRNGKPTSKAKKAKKRLQRWKDSDAKFFDKNPAKNPMDPIDLAEFIF